MHEQFAWVKLRGPWIRRRALCRLSSSVPCFINFFHSVPFRSVPRFINDRKISCSKIFVQYATVRKLNARNIFLLDVYISENLPYPRIPHVQRKVGRFCWRGTDVRERNSQYSRSVRRCCTCTKQSLYTCDTFHAFGRLLILLASSLITFSTSLFANASACDGIAADSSPLGSGIPSFLLKKLRINIRS